MDVDGRQIAGPVIRRALPADREAVEAIVEAAYSPYVARIGKPPGPMRDDYAALIAEGAVTVLEEAGGQIAATSCCCPSPSTCCSTTSPCVRTGKGWVWEGGWSNSPRRRRGGSAIASCGSTRTRR